jgi:hypothetical protein
MLYVLLKFCQNRPKNILFSSRLKKGLVNFFKKGQLRLIWPFIRPNGNPALQGAGGGKVKNKSSLNNTGQ